MYVARIEFTFDAAHRLLGYPGKCASAHGHTFRAEVVVATPALDALGLTLDFRDLKSGLREWVDAHWDHAFLVNDRDTALVDALRALPDCKVYAFAGVNPSTEAIARALFEEACRQFGPVVQKVRIWETPQQYAEYLPDPAPASSDAAAELGTTAQPVPALGGVSGTVPARAATNSAPVPPP